MLDIIEQAVSYAESAKGRLLHTLEHVPDDKLKWSPAETAKCPLRIAAHAASSNHPFALMMKGQIDTSLPREELFAKMEAAEAAITTRDQLIKVIEEGTAGAIEALKALTPEQIAGEVVTPFGAMPMKFIMLLVGRHMDNHAAQIDYLQSIWGDQDMHF